MCGDAMDIVDGHPTGSVRISFGYMSTMEDARRFIDFITNTFLIPVSILFKHKHFRSFSTSVWLDFNTSCIVRDEYLQEYILDISNSNIYM